MRSEKTAKAPDAIRGRSERASASRRSLTPRPSLLAPRSCNCLVWAGARWIRKGGYLAIRSSRFFRFIPHFVTSRTGRFWWGYAPTAPKWTWRAMFHALWFRGHVTLDVPHRKD